MLYLDLINEFDELPEDVRKEAVDLSVIHISNYAWKYEQIELVLQYLLTKEKIILGGDVYKLKHKTPELIYDSWYCDKEDLINNLKQSQDYIKGYYNLNGKDYCYSFILK